MGQDSTSLILNVIVANTFQVVQTILYCNFNAVCTSISLVTEWDRFGSHRKGLRVSAKPQGAQRQTYFLQLPFRYSIPVMIFSGLIHWLISQSIFVVSMESYGPSSENVMAMVPYPEKSFTSCGWSGFGVMIVALSISFMVVYLIIVGSRPLKFGEIPVVGSCSAGISAACHPGLGEPNAWEKPLQWGVVAVSNTGPGHCSFSGGKVDEPQQGLLYA
ncbi:hypothetical protein CCHR01_11122 [Colletotrichum chrysophilum]|uniref:Uncharacterized protein n=1 Tax=Colletotrichum chrysophilum TaxID=1836956 RepID=A0AAD9EFA8_9PEZI|nr:hypothetical protein CCHR01_11122 [Colletotrichum chrysophilum]